jgi:hypothetical protein
MFKKLLNNFNSGHVKRGIKLSALAIAVATFCSSGSYAQDATITAPGAFTNTVPSGRFSVTIELWGAGGNGAGIGPTSNGTSSFAGGGGGGGGYSLFTISVIPGNVYDGTVAATTVTPGNGTPGVTGQPSKVTGLNSAPLAVPLEALGGESGGLSPDGGFGIGGAGGVGNTQTGVAGGNGNNTSTAITSGAGGAGAGPGGGAGGLSVMRDVNNNNNQTGLAGAAPGGGGSGAAGGQAIGGGTNGSRTGKPQSLGAQGQARFTYSSTVLPVSLISFNATASNNQANLSWETASESNNNRFEVSRSSDNITYVTVATITGKGTTNQKSSYTATDVNPSNGVNYYKLIQIDNDGTTKELAIKSLNFSLNNVQELTVYPNPASGSLNVQIANNKSASSAILTLININGQVVLSKAVQLNQGINTLTLDISNNIVPGQYVLTATGASINKSLKVNIK